MIGAITDLLYGFLKTFLVLSVPKEEIVPPKLSIASPKMGFNIWIYGKISTPGTSFPL